LPVETAASPTEFQRIADASPAPMWVTGLDRRRTFVNRAYVDFVGVDGQAALDFDWRAILHPDDEEQVVAASQAGEASLAPFTLEGRYRRADGEWRWIRSVSQPRFDETGAHNGFIGVAHDVTEARQGEAVLRQREQELAALFDQTAAGLAQVDMSGCIVRANQRFCQILGRELDALIGANLLDLTAPEDLAANIALVERAIEHGTPYTHEKRYLRPDGSPVWVSNAVSLLRGPDGTPQGMLAVTLDITDRRTTEGEIRANETRLAFLDALGAATADAVDADQVMAITTRMLGEHLGVSDCAYADVEADENHFHIRGDWHRDDAPSIVGDYRLEAFGSLAVQKMRGGQPLVIDDIITELGEDGGATFVGIGIRATIVMPFIMGGRLAGMMAIHDAAPRRWTAAEQALLREVSDRSWAHVQRVRAEAALRESERRLRLALEGARIGTWDLDVVTGRGSWSSRAAEIVGVPHNVRLSAEQRAQMIYPDDRARVERGQARLVLAGTEFADEYRIVRPDGAVRWIASHGAIERDAEGRPLRAIGTIRDVTEAREAQEQLRALADTLEAQVAERTAERDGMWRLSRDLMLVIGRDRRVRAANPALAGLGYAPEEVIGQRLGPFIHPDDRVAATAAIRAAAYHPIGEFHARLRAKDGGWRAFAWSAAPGEGEAYVIGRDVTTEVLRREELAEAQEQLRQAQKMESLGQLTGGVAHDFNNLLTPILGGLDMLARDPDLPERRKRLVRGALESAERARVLVQRLLAFARRQPLQPQPVDMAGLLDTMRELIASTVGPQIEVRADTAAELPPALADRNQLELAMLNLAVNARDAMPEGGRLTLAASEAHDPADLRAGRYVRLSVTDTGVGMDAETAARAVEPFFSTKGVGKGTGLGLSMVHGLASQLGGAMRIHSRPGEGTRVELFLPVADAATQAECRPAAVVGGPHSGRVLLVDDEPDVRAATAEMLAGLGYDVATAASGTEALTALGGKPDLLVTDHLMPGMTGADLARAARARRPDLKILLISGYAGIDQVPPDLPRLAKPFRLAELARSLAAL
jgi:PAS domain S-box-containing protein